MQPQPLYLEGFSPQTGEDGAGDDVWTGFDPFNSTLTELQDAPTPEISFYIHDHLGNLRVLYHTTFKACTANDIVYHLEHVADYYPFGKSLREYVSGTEEKFLTTHHERDVETGLDYRGARFYDGEVGRFLSVDPLAADYAGWSTYNYVLGNPVMLVDPDGREVIFNSHYKDQDGKEYEIDWSTVINELQELTGLTLEIGEGGVLKNITKGNSKGGSETARLMLLNAIKPGAKIYVSSHPANVSAVNDMDSDDIKERNSFNLNFIQIQDFIDGTSDDLNDLTYGYGMNFLHELGHTDAMGAKLDFENGDYAASNLDNMNKIRAELTEITGTNFGERVDYRPGFAKKDPTAVYERFSHHANRKLNVHKVPKHGFIRRHRFSDLMEKE